MTLGRVNKLLLPCLQVRLGALSGILNALSDSGFYLFGDDLGLHVLRQILGVRLHAAPDLEHLPLYALRCFIAHGLSCPFTQFMFC